MGYSGEVAGYVEGVILDFAEHIKVENAQIIQQIFMVQKQLREQTKILAKDWVFQP